MKPTISICIPTYNGDQYLEECLDSVISQTFQNFEVLLVDDQSSDRTLEIAKRYSSKDDRFRVICNEKNLGLVGNWNRCAELAEGQWIKYVFQDDYISPQCLEKMLDATKHNSYIVSCRRKLLFDDEVPEYERNILRKIETLSTIFPDRLDISADEYCKLILNDIGCNHVGEPTALLINRDAFSKFGYFNPNLVQVCDFELWTRTAIKTGIANISEELATFRVHKKSTSSRNHGSKRYRTQVLDPLILLHDYALQPNYEPLRNVAKGLSKPVKLFDLLADRTREAWKAAMREPECLSEWEKTSNSFPILATLYKRSLPQRIFRFTSSKFTQTKMNSIGSAEIPPNPNLS